MLSFRKEMRKTVCLPSRSLQKKKDQTIVLPTTSRVLTRIVLLNLLYDPLREVLFYSYVTHEVSEVQDH